MKIIMLRFGRGGQLMNFFFQVNVQQKLIEVFSLCVCVCVCVCVWVCVCVFPPPTPLSLSIYIYSGKAAVTANSTVGWD